VILREEVKERTLMIEDWVALTRDAAERIISFVADYSSMVRQANVQAAINDPILQLIPRNAFEFKYILDCMLRIVSVPGALKARGYPIGVEAEIHLDIEDDIIPQNNGRFILKVKDGKGTVKKGGDGNIKVDIRTLAQMYAGYLAPIELKKSGKLDASDEDCLKAMPVFAGPRPWIRNDF
jgi:predicted acetyltransferase